MVRGVCVICQQSCTFLWADPISPLVPQITRRRFCAGDDKLILQNAVFIYFPESVTRHHVLAQPLFMKANYQPGADIAHRPVAKIHECQPQQQV